MRNLFETVFCEDCDYCMLAKHYNDTDDQLAYSRCKVRPRPANTVGVGRVFRGVKDYNFCQTVKKRKFCFHFKTKTNI